MADHDRNCMMRKLLLSAVIPACIAFQTAALPASSFAGEPSGGVGGVTRDSVTGLPIPEAQIVVHNENKNTSRTAVSGSNGFFAIDNLEPGRYEVIATKQGFKNFSARVGGFG